HTRSDRDWSSDVCSSDLVGGLEREQAILVESGEPHLAGVRMLGRVRQRLAGDEVGGPFDLLRQSAADGDVDSYRQRGSPREIIEIGRASCREGRESSAVQ